jgi:hypothetical protein
VHILETEFQLPWFHQSNLFIMTKQRKEEMMNTLIKQFVTVVIGVIVLTSPAWGITYGDFDGNGHPFVAAVVGINTADDAVRGRCSGALIQLEYDRSAILTAGHCADFWFAVGNDAVGISFDPVIGGDPDNSSANSLKPEYYFTGGTVVLHPDYGPPGSWNPQNDLAIVVFNDDETQYIMETWGNIFGFEAASIVPPNFLGDLKKKELKMLEVKNVGFGIIERLVFPGSNAGGVKPAQGYGVRRVSFPSSVISIDPTRVHMSQNPARKDEGTCNGDSGSPNYIDYAGDPNVIVSVTSSGDSFCRATNIGARVDTPAAVEFINCVLDTDIDELEQCGIVEIMN